MSDLYSTIGEFDKLIFCRCLFTSISMDDQIQSQQVVDVLVSTEASN